MSSVTADSASIIIKSANDLATLSNPDDIRQKHYSLELEADFNNNILIGSTTITFVVLKENANIIKLDTNELNIKSVSMDDAAIQWDLGNVVEPFGKPLSVTLPKVFPLNTEIKVKIPRLIQLHCPLFSTPLHIMICNIYTRLTLVKMHVSFFIDLQ